MSDSDRDPPRSGLTTMMLITAVAPSYFSPGLSINSMRRILSTGIALNWLISALRPFIRISASLPLTVIFCITSFTEIDGIPVLVSRLNGDEDLFFTSSEIA